MVYHISLFRAPFQSRTNMFTGFFPSFSLDDSSDESDDILGLLGHGEKSRLVVLAASKNLVNNCYTLEH